MGALLKLSALSLLFFSTSFALPVSDPLNVKDVKRLVERGDLILGNPVSGEIAVYTYEQGRLRPLTGFRVGFKEGMNILVGNYTWGEGEQLLLLRSKEVDKKATVRGSLDVFQLKGKQFRRVSSFAYGVSKNDSFAVAYFYPDHYNSYLIRGNSKKNRIEVIAPNEYIVSTYKTDVERFDKVAAGDIDGDGADEIAFADANRDEIQLFKYDLKRRKLLKFRRIKNSPAGIYDREDLVAFGDIDGDGKEELLFLKSKRGILYAFNERGRVESSYKNRLMKGATSMVSFDADGDGFGEVFIGSPQTGALLIVKRVLRADGSYRWKVSRVRGIRFLEGQVLAGGDLRGLSLYVGKPLPPERVELPLVPLVVINDPPKERSLFGKPHEALGKLFAAYTSSRESSDELRVEQSVGVSFSVERKYSKRTPMSFFMEKVKSAVKRKVEKSYSTSGYRRVVERLEQGLIADGYQDKGVYLSGSYYAFYYPILAPKELAFKNGKRQYLLVTLPDTSVMRIGVPYTSSVHIPGFVASYPGDRFGLYHYKPENELARGEMVIGCGRTRISYTKSVEKGSTSSKEVSEGRYEEKESRLKIPLMGKLTKVLPFDPSAAPRTKEKSSYTFSFTAYTVYLKKVDSFTVESKGDWSWCSEPDKSYTVGVVVYTDSEDGHLILDYYVPQRGSYYKEPPYKPVITPFFLDVKSGKKLYLAPVKADLRPVFR